MSNLLSHDASVTLYDCILTILMKYLRLLTNLKSPAETSVLRQNFVNIASSLPITPFLLIDKIHLVMLPSRIWHSRKWYCWTCFAPGLLGVFNILGGCSNSSSISFIATKWECGQFDRPLHLLSWVRIFHLSLVVVLYWRITFLPTSSVFK